MINSRHLLFRHGEPHYILVLFLFHLHRNSYLLGKKELISFFFCIMINLLAAVVSSKRDKNSRPIKKYENLYVLIYVDSDKIF